VGTNRGAWEKRCELSCTGKKNINAEGGAGNFLAKKEGRQVSQAEEGNIRREREPEGKEAINLARGRSHSKGPEERKLENRIRHQKPPRGKPDLFLRENYLESLPPESPSSF